MAPLVDIHTHIYPPSYISLLSSRSTVPYIHHPTPTQSNPSPSPRLIILPTDDSPSLPPSQRGRPIDPSYSSLSQKLSFMSQHAITTSILSLANPWLDFLPPSTAPAVAQDINSEMALLSTQNPGKIYAFATLPLSAPTADIVAEITRLSSEPDLRKAIKGIILSTSGLGSGLDDPELDPIWAALEEKKMLIFLHPHYGLPASVFGPADRQKASGHVLPLALGFPMETTIAFTRMYLSGVFDRFPGLRVLLAHAGGTVPFLAGRVESCIAHERAYFAEGGRGERVGGPKRGLKEIMRGNVWLDAVVYGGTGVRAAVEMVGRERVLWGTDHPFFPPVGEEEGEEGKGEWLSVRTNVEGVREAFGEDEVGAEGVLGGNAVELLGLEV